MKITHRLALVLAALTFFATTASSASECADHLTTKGAARTIDLTTEEAVGDNGPYADCIVDTAVFQCRVSASLKQYNECFFTRSRDLMKSDNIVAKLSKDAGCVFSSEVRNRSMHSVLEVRGS